MINNLFLIIKKGMAINLSRTNIKQYFGETTYHYILQTVKKYKLFLISGFDVKIKRQIYTIMSLYQKKNKLLLMNYFLY